jgi:hypothetical protein
LRQYAEDRLVERDVIAEVRDRHLVWMGALAKSIRADAGTPSAVGSLMPP